MDIFASLISKFQPVADSVILHSLLKKMAQRFIDNQIVSPEQQEGPQQKVKRAIEKYVLRPIKEEPDRLGPSKAGAPAAGQIV